MIFMPLFLIIKKYKCYSYGFLENTTFNNLLKLTHHFDDENRA